MFKRPFLLLALLLLLLSTAACTLPAPGPTALPTLADTLTPTPPPTLTPTPMPTPTPTLAPAQRVASGDYELFLGDWLAASQAYQTAFGETTDAEIQSAARLGAGRAALAVFDYPAALDAFRQVVDAYPASPHVAEAYFFLGQAYDGLGRYAEAAEAYRSYRQLRPGVLDAYVSERAGDSLTAAGDHAGALTEYTLSLQAPRLPADFSLELKIAQAYLALGDYTTAQITWDDIYARTGNDYIKAQVDYSKGQAYAALGQFDLAYAAYLDAVMYYPRSYYAYASLVELVNSGYQVDELQRGLVDYYAKAYGVAVAAFDRYLAAGPADPATAYYYKGLSWFNQGDYGGAIAQWDVIIQSYDTHSLWDDAWEMKAYIQWAMLGDYAAARQTLLDFAAISPGHERAAEFLFDAAGVAEREGQLAEAARLWQRIPGEYPSSTYVYRALFLAGICHYRLGDFAAAQSVFLQARALAIDPSEMAGASFWIAKTHAALGDAAAAQTAYEQTATLDPTGYYSERARDILGSRAPFTPPQVYDLGSDPAAERAEAEAWLRSTFALPEGSDMGIPGPLAGDPRFVRGEEFWRLGLYEQAAAEFENLRLEVANDPVHCYRLAVHLSELGLYRSAIFAARQVLTLAGMDDAATLNAPMLFNRIRFGTYYSELVIPTAAEYGFHPLFIWSVMRQESLFEGFIRSSAGARGLMQIMPDTGAEVAYRIGWPAAYTNDDLYRPLVSLRLGADYLAYQRDIFGGDVMVALAAYNGGPGNAYAWSGLAGGDPDLLVEVIRFEETRNYLKGIYEIFTIYRRLYNRTP